MSEDVYFLFISYVGKDGHSLVLRSCFTWRPKVVTLPETNMTSHLKMDGKGRRTLRLPFGARPVTFQGRFG